MLLNKISSQFFMFAPWLSDSSTPVSPGDEEVYHFQSSPVNWPVGSRAEGALLEENKRGALAEREKVGRERGRRIAKRFWGVRAEIRVICRLVGVSPRREGGRIDDRAPFGLVGVHEDAMLLAERDAVCPFVGQRRVAVEYPVAHGRAVFHRIAGDGE